MYEYTWYQWLTFFFIYCFFGWIFESTYVSAKTGHFVNRGFLRLPLLPLYGTGAVMMLWVSLPVKDNLFLVYLAGVIAATILEYVTGWGMEKLFKMKYWDYSNQRFNVKGYICLSSSIAWGFLTIFLTEVVHRPIEHYVLGLPVMVNIIFVLITSLLFAADTAESVKTALDLAKVLDAMTDMRAELDDIQVQMALLKAETSERVAEAREEAAARLSRMKSGAAVHAAALKDDTAERLNELVENTLKNGGKVDDIKDQLKNYGKQLADLDKQIAGLYAQQAKACAEPDDKKKTDRTDPHKTEEQREVERLSSLANVSDGIRNAEKISAVKDRGEGEMHVKEAEVSQGGVHVDALVSKGMGGAANVADMVDNETSALKRKEMEIAALGDRASALGDSQAKSLGDSMDALEENREADDPVREDKAEKSREENKTEIRAENNTGIWTEESGNAKNTGSGKTDTGTLVS